MRTYLVDKLWDSYACSLHSKLKIFRDFSEIFFEIFLEFVSEFFLFVEI